MRKPLALLAQSLQTLAKDIERCTTLVVGGRLVAKPPTAPLRLSSTYNRAVEAALKARFVQELWSIEDARRIISTVLDLHKLVQDTGGDGAPPSLSPSTVHLTHRTLLSWKFMEALQAALLDLETIVGPIAEQHSAPSETQDILDVRRRTLTLDGEIYPLTHEQARIIQRLAEAGGGFIPGSDLKKYAGSSEDPGKTILRLPPQVRAIIEGKRGANGGRRLLRSLDVMDVTARE